MRLGEQLKLLREQRGLLQREIAAELKIDTPMYSKIERGTRRVKKQQVLQLATFFNIKEEALMSIWLADQIVDLLKEEKYGQSGFLIAGRDLYPNHKARK